MKEKTTAWLELARRDLKATEALINEKELANIVLFHAQQAIEKSLKSVIEGKDRTVPRIHSVVKLHPIITEELALRAIADEDDLNLYRYKISVRFRTSSFRISGYGKGKRNPVSLQGNVFYCDESTKIV